MKTAGSRFLSLSTKLMLSVVVVVAVAALLVANGLGQAARGRLIEAKATAVSMLSDLLAVSLAPAVDFGDAEAVNTQLVHLQTNRDLTYAGVWGRTGDEPLVEVGRRTHGKGRPGAGSTLEVGRERIAVVRALKISPDIYLYTSDPSISQHLPGFDGGFSRKGDDEALLAQVDAAFRLKRLRDAAKARRLKL